MYDSSKPTHQDYTVGCICALPIERAAAEGILDRQHDPLEYDRCDHNSYTLGCIGVHNVVITCLPTGLIGTISAATVATQMLSSFQNLRFGLMLGIGGGVPSQGNDIRLGDVVVSKPTETFGGVIQYDFGKTVLDGRLKRTGFLNRPPNILLSAISSLQARDIREGHKLSEHLADMKKRCPKMAPQLTYPGSQHDSLYEPEYNHERESATCSKCDAHRLVYRGPRSSESPVVHYGLIASGDQVMRHAGTRDRLGQELDVLCFEMEAAGLLDNFPCLIIRGISDYADSHKNKRWQAYAAAVAAAYAKELLNIISGIQVRDTRRAAETTPDAGSFERENQKLNSNFPSRGMQKRKSDTRDLGRRKRTAQNRTHNSGSNLNAHRLDGPPSVEDNSPWASSVTMPLGSSSTPSTRVANTKAFAENHNKILYRAAKSGDEAVLGQLLSDGADVSGVDKNGDNLIHIAACNGHEAVVRLLLGKGVSVAVPNKQKGATPLHFSAIRGDRAIVQLLLEHCAGFSGVISAANEDRDTALHLAAWKGHESTSELLLQRGADVNSRNKDSATPLHFAAEKGHLPVATLLLKNGAAIDAATVGGDTPLHFAAWHGQDTIAKLLLSEGADPNAKGNDNDTPLHVSVCYRHEAMTSLLIEHGASTTVINKFQKTPLHLAAYEGYLSITTLLLDNGARIDSREEGMHTPLHCAAQKGHGRVVKLLLEKGANVDALNERQETALQLAKVKRRTGIVKLLQEAKMSRSSSRPAGSGGE